MLKTMKKTMLIGLILFQTMTVTAANNSQVLEKLSTQEAYQFGQVSMRTKDWQNAIEAFSAAAKDKQLKDAAMYWQAYSYYQVKQNAQARRMLQRLIQQHPDSQWVDDAHVLLFEHGDGGKNTAKQGQLDDELKLFTLQQIMFNKPEKALPKVYSMLEESKSEQVKHNAIQLLGLSDSEQVSDYLFRFIEKEKNPGLQHQAIQMLSLRDSENSRNKLQKLYDNTQDNGIKGAIIQGFIHHEGSANLLTILQQEQDPELSRHLIQMLGIKGESEALKDLYKTSGSDQKRAILESIGMSGDASFLYQIIDSETDQKIRNQAIHSLVMVEDDNMGEYLAKLYEKANNEAEKGVISKVFIATDVEPAIITRIYNSETNEGLKHQLINTLMAMDQVEALKDLYNQETDTKLQSVILRQFGMMDATEVLMDLYQKNPQLIENPAFFQSLGMSHSGSDPTVDKFLMARFKQGSEQVKEGVLQTLLMQENSKLLVKLFKTETDTEIKKQIIRMIGITDPDFLLDALED